MDLGFQLSPAEQEKIREQARKEMEQEDRLAAEAAQAVDAKVRAEAEVASWDAAGLAESDEGAEPVNVDGPLEKEMPEDEGYGSGEEEEDGAKGGDAEAGSSVSDPVDTLDDAPIRDGSITPDSSDGEITGSGPSTPLGSPLASIDEDPEDEGFVEGDKDSIPENKITPEGSTDEIQTDSELDGSQDGPISYNDDGMSVEESEKQDLKMNRKTVKFQLKALAAREAEEMKEAAGSDVPAEKEDKLPDDPDAETSTDEQTQSTSSVPTPPASKTSTKDADADAVSTSDPTPPVSPIPSPKASTASTRDLGPFAPQETDRRVLRNSAAKRVIAALFPGDQQSGSKIVAKDADELIDAAVSAVAQRQFPIKAGKKAGVLAKAYGGSMSVNEAFMMELGRACAEVAEVPASLESKPSGSIKERIVKQMEVNGTSVIGEQPAQSI